MYSFILIPDFHLSWARRRAQTLTTYPWQNWTSILSRTPGRAISSVTEGVKIPRGILSFHKLGLGIKCTTMLSFSSVYEMHCCLNGCVRKVTRTPLTESPISNTHGFRRLHGGVGALHVTGTQWRVHRSLGSRSPFESLHSNHDPPMLLRRLPSSFQFPRAFHLWIESSCRRFRE